jgi:hypothetical protein
MKPSPESNPAAVTETAREQSMAHVPERRLRNHELLANIDPAQVVATAATLRLDGRDKIEAVREAYDLWDIVLHCQESLTNQASVEAGIKSYQKGVKVDEEFYGALEKIPHYEYKRDKAGKKEWVDFDEGVEAAIPLPKSTRDKPMQRAARLRRFIKEMVLPKTHPELNEVECITEAIEQVERMKRDGIEPNFFAFLRVRFPSWWEETQARDDSTNGQRGQAVKKRKRRQVKSGPDKRKGARPKEEDFAKITKIPVEELQELREAIRSGLT